MMLTEEKQKQTIVNIRKSTMKIWLTGILLLCGILTVMAQGKVTTMTLNNGMTVWLCEDHSEPTVFGAVVVKAGAANCPGTGIAHYFEHIMFKGTDKIGTIDYAAERPWLDSISQQYDLLAKTKVEATRKQIQAHINKLNQKAAQYAIPNEFNNLIMHYGGSGLNAFTDLDETVYHNSFSPQYISQWLEINSERLINPVFRLFQGELETVYEEKNRASDNMLLEALNAVNKKIYEGTPYEWPVIGTTENLKNPQLSKMRQFFHDYYVAGNMGLMLCGDFNTETVKQQLEPTFGRIRAGKAPELKPFNFKPLDGTQTLKLLLPIPFLKAVGYAFRTPTMHDSDYQALEVALGLLSNGFGSGMIDSLANNHQMFVGLASIFAVKQAGIAVVASVPKILVGSKGKVEKLLWQQIDRLQRGDFEDRKMEAIKEALRIRGERQLESLSDRSTCMIEAFSYGFDWNSYVKRLTDYSAITKSDVERVARTYLTRNKSLSIVKKLGRYPKDKIQKPDYDAVIPQHVSESSAYAKSLEQMPINDIPKRYLDLDNDAQRIELAPMATLYSVKNPVNDLFSLSLTFSHETLDKRQLMAGVYAVELGTPTKTLQQMNKNLEKLYANINFDSDEHGVKITASGPDRNFAAVVNLLKEWCWNFQADNEKWKELKQTVKVGEATEKKDNEGIRDAVIKYVVKGRNEVEKTTVTSSDLKLMTPDDVLEAWRDALKGECDIVYSGTLPSEKVAEALTTLPLESLSIPYQHARQKVLQPVSEPTVYIYDNPKARQTYVGAYIPVKATPQYSDLMRSDAWTEYFGGGMSSVMFQNLREFSSLAYSAEAQLLESPHKIYPNAPKAILCSMGTQSDKAMTALAKLDSLLNDMPVNERNIEESRQSLKNIIYADYPNFRKKGEQIASLRRLGYKKDPNRERMTALANIGNQDIIDYYKSIKSNPRAYIIVGDESCLDINKLSQYGKVVKLTKKDVFVDE